jgi:hypothetical protein
MQISSCPTGPARAEVFINSGSGGKPIASPVKSFGGVEQIP